MPIPTPFNALTFTPKITIPSAIVRHCFTFPQTVIVRAPVFLFVEKEEMLRTNARRPLPRSARRRLVDGVGIGIVCMAGMVDEVREVVEEMDAGKKVRHSLNEESSPDR
jgi:hypothetical protein